jgi:uncharacterized protein YeaO (DUF488 family)
MQKKSFLIVLALLVAGALVSCTSKVNDIRLSSLEKSIEKLEQNYSKYSPEKLKKEIEHVEKQFDEFSEKKDELSQDQRRQLSDLKAKYHKILVEILFHDVSDESTETVAYLKGLLEGE